MGVWGHGALTAAVRVVGAKAVGADAADAVDAVGRLAIGLGRFHETAPPMVAILEQVIIQEVVGFSAAWRDGGQWGVAKRQASSVRKTD